jgi:hypothetical protein
MIDNQSRKKNNQSRSYTLCPMKGEIFPGLFRRPCATVVIKPRRIASTKIKRIFSLNKFSSSYEQVK